MTETLATVYNSGMCRLALLVIWEWAIFKNSPFPTLEEDGDDGRGDWRSYFYGSCGRNSPACGNTGFEGYVEKKKTRRLWLRLQRVFHKLWKEKSGQRPIELTFLYVNIIMKLTWTGRGVYCRSESYTS